MTITQAVCSCIAFSLIIGSQTCYSAPNDPRLAASVKCSDATLADTPSTSIRIGNTKITLLNVYFWRDWQPIVAQPGKDGGSPLHLVVKLCIENNASIQTHLSYTAKIVEQSGRTYDLNLDASPNYRLIQDKDTRFPDNLDGKSRVALYKKYNIIWNGDLRPNETREVELTSHDGPYLSLDGLYAVEMLWIDATDNKSIKMVTPAEMIHRTE